VAHAPPRRNSSNRSAIATIGISDGNFAATKLEYPLLMNQVRICVARPSHTLFGVGLALMVHIPGIAGAQPAEATALPTALPAVIYPDHVPITAPPAPLPSIGPPIADNGGPIIYQQVEGVWGYWDRYRHFHRRPDEGVRAHPLEHPVVRSVVRPRPVEIVRHAEGHHG
jgi:hypothetical protein